MKFRTVFTACKDSGLNVSLDKCVVMKMSGNTRGTGKIKCNNYDIKVESLRNVGSKIVPTANVKKTQKE
jgi:hypothetical protein